MSQDRLRVRAYYCLSYARCQKSEAIYVPRAPLLLELDEVNQEPSILTAAIIAVSLI